MTADPHPTDAELRAYGLGKLDARSADTVDTHLTDCGGCRDRLTSMSADSFVKRMRAAKPPDGTAVQQGGVPTAPYIPADDEPTAALSGSGLYADVRALGQGGMGTVYLARNVRLDRPEVLKVVSRELLDKPGAGDRFVREMQSAARLAHPNIVTAYAAPEFGGLVVFAMEYVPGEDLSKIVKARGPLKVPTACYYAYQVALGLQHAHEKGMVHRDIKPSNLMLLAEGKKRTVKILDFGLAKAKNETKTAHELTGTNAMLGTPDYMSPEQTTDAAAADIRADIYALGGTLYFLLTGRPPYTAKNLLDLLLMHRDAPPPDPRAVRPDMPAELVAVLARMMAKNPADRFPTPSAAATALKPFFLAGGTNTGTSVDGTAPDLPLDAEPVAPPKPAAKAEKPLPAVFKNMPIPNHTSHLNPEDYDPPARPKQTKPKRPKPEKPKRPIWPWAIAGGVAATVVGAVLLFAGPVKVKTPEGTLIVSVDQPDAELLVDGQTVTVQWKDGQTAEVRVKPGTRKVEVRKGGFTAFGEEVTVEAGGGKTVTARLVPTPKPVPAVLAPKGSEWAGFADFTPADGAPFRQLITLTFTDRQGESFRWEVRSSKGTGAAVAGTIDPAGRIHRHTSQQLRPTPGPVNTGGSLTGTVDDRRMMYDWVVPSGDRGHVELKRLPDGGAGFDFRGKWTVKRGPTESGTITVTGDDSLRGTDGPGKYSRDGGMIHVDYGIKGDEWLVLDPDKPGVLAGLFVRGEMTQPVTWTRADPPAAMLAPKGSEWAGYADVTLADGKRVRSPTTLTFIDRRGDEFRWETRNSRPRAAAVTGTIGADGRIHRLTSQGLRPVVTPVSTDGSLTGTVDDRRMVFDWVVPLTGERGHVELKRLPDNGAGFDFRGTWMVTRSGSPAVTVTVDATAVRNQDGKAAKFTRDGGLIYIDQPSADEWLVLDPDRPNELTGTYTRNGSTQTVTWTRAEPPTAPVDAQPFGPGRYRVFPEQMSWKQAKAKCEQLGGRLAVVTDDAHNRFLSGLMTAAGLADAWIGATDEAEEGKWVDIDGRPLRYTNWEKSQPNNKGDGEHFALMWVGRGGEFKENALWSDQPDVSVQHKPGYVCEWPAAAVAAPSAVDRKGYPRGPKGWSKRGDELVCEMTHGGLMFGDLDWTDYTVSLEAQVMSGPTEVNLAVRRPQGWPLRGATIKIHRVIDLWVEGGRDNVPVLTVQHGLRPGGWKRLRMTVSGDTVSAAAGPVDGPDPQPLFTRRVSCPAAGRIEIGVGHPKQNGVSVTHFRNIEVRAPDGRVLWTGLPDPPE